MIYYIKTWPSLKLGIELQMVSFTHIIISALFQLIEIIISCFSFN